MRLRELVEEGIEIFALEGEIDLHYAPVLRSLFQSKIKARCPALILDLSAVDYVDSSGLASIIEYFRDAGEYGGILCLAGLCETVLTTFRIVQLDSTIPIFPSRQEALRFLKQKGVVSPSRPVSKR